MIQQSAHYFHDIWWNNKVKEAQKYPEFFEVTRGGGVVYHFSVSDLCKKNESVFEYMSRIMHRERVESLNTILEEP